MQTSICLARDMRLFPVSNWQFSIGKLRFGLIQMRQYFSRTPLPTTQLPSNSCDTCASLPDRLLYVFALCLAAQNFNSRLERFVFQNGSPTHSERQSGTFCWVKRDTRTACSGGIHMCNTLIYTSAASAISFSRSSNCFLAIGSRNAIPIPSPDEA